MLNHRAVNFVVALPAEARPLIARFALKRRQPDGDFPIYQQGSVALVLSGVGKSAAKAATAFLHSRHTGAPPALWINVGIAGHPDLPIGSPVLAHSLSDEASGQRWKIRLDVPPPCRTEHLATLDRPLLDYTQADHAVDMEATGFYPTASPFAEAGQVHCFKIISDNREHPARGIRAKRVSQLIEKGMGPLCRLLALLDERTPAQEA